jgi:hypothetical protein
MKTRLYDSLIATPKNPRICKLLKGQLSDILFGLRISPKLPQPHKYSSHIAFNAPEWYPAYTLTMFVSS